MDKKELIETVERVIPEFAKACKKKCADNIMMHQDAFAVDYDERELLLLALAIKYAGIKKKNIDIICAYKK